MKPSTQFIDGSRRGATTIEMTLVGIPIMFILISIFEISRGMWVYETLAYAVKNGVRLAIVHGQNCVPTTDNPNSCKKTIADVASLISQSAVGPDPAQTMLTFTPASGTGASVQCYLATPGSNPPYGSHSACSTLSTTTFPPDTSGAYNGVGKRVEIDIETPFHSALSMFWPAAGKTQFGVVNFGATAADYIVF
jgi:hypothetical protein